jgi:hypothetical protein
VRGTLLIAIALCLALPAPAVARSVPPGWVGVNLEPDPVIERGALRAEVSRMARTGVESLRFAAYWSRAQPHLTLDAVPAADRDRFRLVDGVPTDYSEIDRVVGTAALKGLRVMPVVLGAPPWAAALDRSPIAAPVNPAPYASFLGGLVRRYGPNGSYWRAHPDLPEHPVRRWQIWNEVSNPFYWSFLWPTAYPQVLRAAYDAVKRADPGATVVMAGLNTVGAASGNPYPSWNALDLLYRQLAEQGLGRPFDEVAVHVYTSTVPDALRVVRATRRVMSAHGDRRRPLLVSELAWPAAKGRLTDARGRRRDFFAATTPRGQARRLAAGYRLLARHRRDLGIAGVSWFQWASTYRGTKDPFRYAGLRRLGSRATLDTPALRSFRAVARSLDGRAASAGR